jgi:hypothetical protein
MFYSSNLTHKGEGDFFALLCRNSSVSSLIRNFRSFKENVNKKFSSSKVHQNTPEFFSCAAWKACTVDYFREE